MNETGILPDQDKTLTPIDSAVRKIFIQRSVWLIFCLALPCEKQQQLQISVGSSYLAYDHILAFPQQSALK